MSIGDFDPLAWMQGIGARTQQRDFGVGQMVNNQYLNNYSASLNALNAQTNACAPPPAPKPRPKSIDPTRPMTPKELHLFALSGVVR